MSLSLLPFGHLSTPLSLSSPCRELPPTVWPPSSHRNCARAARGGSPAADVPRLNFSQRRALASTVFGHFRCCPASFHGEATFFGTSSLPSTKPCPPRWTNRRRWKVDYYSHRVFDGFFQWTKEVSWGETPKSFMYSSNAFIWNIYWLCFWKTRFTRSNYQFERCINLRVGLTRGLNWKLRPPRNSFRCHKPSGGLKILKWASVRKCIFRGKLVAPFCVKIQFVDFRDSVLENEHTPILILMSRIQFWG